MKKDFEKKCGESCGCAAEEKNKTTPQNLTALTEEKISTEEKLDPTHFGDWQVNCRAIDF